MTVPTRLILQDYYYLLEGGTIYLQMIDESGKRAVH